MLQQNLVPRLERAFDIGPQRDIVWFTLWQAVASTALTLVIGLPAASIVARLSPRRQRLVRALVTVPFVLPTVLVAGAFTEVFAVTGLDEGALRLRHTVWAILIAHVFFNYAVVVRTVGAFWSGLDPRMEEAARSLGATAWAAFREVTLPRLRPAIASAAAIESMISCVLGSNGTSGRSRHSGAFDHISP